MIGWLYQNISDPTAKPITFLQKICVFFSWKSGSLSDIFTRIFYGNKKHFSPLAAHGFYHLERQENGVWNWFEKVIPDTGSNMGEGVSVPAEVDPWAEEVD